MKEILHDRIFVLNSCEFGYTNPTTFSRGEFLKCVGSSVLLTLRRIIFTIKPELSTAILAIVGATLILFSIPIEAGAIKHDNDTSLKFTWSPASGNVDHYNVYMYTEKDKNKDKDKDKNKDKDKDKDKDEYVLVAITSETTYTINSKAKYTYKVKVEAVDAAGNVGPMSDESEPVICDPIEPVADLRASVSGNSIILTWTASIDAVSYNVYRDTDPNFTPDKTGGSNRIATGVNDEDPVVVGIQWTDWSDGVVGDVSDNYYYIVTAVSALDSESENSNVVGEYDIFLQTTVGLDWNLIALPLDDGSIRTASQLQAAIPNAKSVAYWNASQQRYVQYIYIAKGVEFNNFDVTPGYAYYVSVTSDTIWTIVGNVTAPSFNLQTTDGSDWNTISVPLSRTDITKASQLQAAIPNADSVAYWNIFQQRYVQYIYIAKGVEFNNFNVVPGGAYYVSVTKNSVWPRETVPTAPDKDLTNRSLPKPVILK